MASSGGGGGGSFMNPELSERSFSFWLGALSQVFLLVFLFGFISLLTNIYNLANWINIFITRTSSLSRYQHGARYTTWALVTGATAGIGKSFAANLAARGFNVVLHGRNPSKLAAVADALAQRYPDARFRTVVADASNSHGMKAAVQAVADALADLPGPLAVLVNNVGGMGGLPLPRTYMTLAEYQAAYVDAVVNVNLRFTTQVTRALLPQLLRSAPALILNAGSLSGNYGLPYIAVYSGTKAYLEKWSQALMQELAIEGYDVECLHVLFGHTTGTQGTKDPESFMLPSADTAASGALHKVGCGRSVVAACVGHWVAGFLGQVLPEWAFRMLMRKVMLDLAEKEKREAKKA